MDMLPESSMTFSELAKWYLSLKTVKKLASYDRVEGYLNNFNQVFGEKQVSAVRPIDLEDYLRLWRELENQEIWKLERGEFWSQKDQIKQGNLPEGLPKAQARAWEYASPRS